MREGAKARYAFDGQNASKRTDLDENIFLLIGGWNDVSIKLSICRSVMIMIVTVIVFGGNTFLETPAQLCRGNLELFAAVIYPVRAEAAPAEFDVDGFAEILYLFDVDNKYARLKTRFIENFEKLPPESRNKVIQMYLGGKKEQPDKLLLMKGMSATANFLRGLETAQSTIKQYTETGIADEDADFSGIASGSAIVEYFPNSGSRIIPFLKNPNDIITLGDQITAIFKEIIAKNRAEAAQSRARIAETNKRTAETNKRTAELEERIAIIKEINDMLEKALGK